MAIDVSVVVPVYNAEGTLTVCLRGLNTQSLPKSDFEVIVVDGASTDSSAQIARTFGFRLLREKKPRGAAAGRNEGLRVAQGEWVAFTDADCLPSRNWLRYLLKAANMPYQSVAPIGVAGKTIGHHSDSTAARFVDLTGGGDAETYLRHPAFPFAPTNNVMYRREALQLAGGFDERYYSYEPCDLYYRLVQVHQGRRALFFEPRAVVFHRHRTNWKDYWRQQYWHGQGLGQFMLHHKDKVQWSLSREIGSWRNLLVLATSACLHRDGNDGLIRRGSFIRELAQRTGFISTYWNILERKRW
jgi:glycosyltransferase involved in cell wall biosynthesis